MSERSEFLVLGRRLHDALRHAVSDGGGRTGAEWLQSEKPLFDHYACGWYLAGTLAFLEGRYGENAWSGALDSFVAAQSDDHQANYAKAKVTEATCDALVCIRNAIIHNDGDLAMNRDPDSLAKVTAAALPGVHFAGTVVKLSSEPPADFMNTVRLCFVAVSGLHGRY